MNLRHIAASIDHLGKITPLPTTNLYSTHYNILRIIVVLDAEPGTLRYATCCKNVVRFYVSQTEYRSHVIRFGSENPAFCSLRACTQWIYTRDFFLSKTACLWCLSACMRAACSYTFPMYTYWAGKQPRVLGTLNQFLFLFLDSPLMKLASSMFGGRDL